MRKKKRNTKDTHESGKDIKDESLAMDIESAANSHRQNKMVEISESSNTIKSSQSLKKESKDFLKQKEEIKYSIGSCPLLNESQKGIILKSFEYNCEIAQHSSELAVRIFQEAKENSLLKVVEATVPEGILPPGYSCALYDVRISYHGPDEKIYRNNKWIRDNVTRGMNIMQLTGKEKKFDFAIYANRKFTGGIGDEDDYQPESNDIWEEFCLDSPQNSSEVICMTKLNGEAGHFTVRQIGDEYYIIAGSKNVHMLYKTYADIEKYTDSRFLVARTVAEAVLDTFNDMEDSKLMLLKQFLNMSKTTVVCELLQPHYQHIVELSHLKKSIVHVLMLTSVPESDTISSLTTLPPHVCLEFFKSFGISIPDYYSIFPQDVKENILKMRHAKNSEGYVLYYLIEDRTIGLAKVKTMWYVVLRALREKVDYAFNSKKAAQKPLSETIKATRKRVGEIQKWLKFCDNCLEKWKNLGEDFAHWLDREIKAGRICSKNIRPKFPCIWNEFVTQNEKNDDFCSCDVT